MRKSRIAEQYRVRTVLVAHVALHAPAAHGLKLSTGSVGAAAASPAASNTALARGYPDVASSEPAQRSKSRPFQAAG